VNAEFLGNSEALGLNGACAGGQLEIARWLVSKGADVRRAPHCKDVLLGN
jgi:hypothetical protein